MRRIAVFFLVLLSTRAASAQPAAGRFDGNWTTSLACEAHGQMPAYKWQFPAVIAAGVFHAVHGEPGGPGYLTIDGPVKDDGTAKLTAKGTVQNSQAHGVFAIKGNNYDYVIKAQFTATTGSGTRDEGMGILGRACTFDFARQPAPAEAAPPAP